MAKSKVVNAGIWYTVGNYLIRGIGFITLPLFTRVLSTNDYGMYNLFVAYESLLFIMIGLAIHSSYKNARYKYKTVEEGAPLGKDYHTYVSSTMILIMIGMIVCFIIDFLFKDYLSTFLGIDNISICILIVYSFAMAVIACFNSYASLNYEYKTFLSISGLNAIGNVVLSFIFIFLFFNNERYLGRVVGTVVPSFLIAIWIIYWFFKKAKPMNLRYFLSWGVKYSLPIVPHGMSQVLLAQCDRIMILKIINASVAGIYSFAYTVFGIVNITVSSLDNVWSPWFYEKMDKKNYKDIK